MRIGLVAPPWVPVPPEKYGGTEEVVDVLARGLAARGHDVVLFTTGDATCPVPRRFVYARPPAEMNATLPELRHVQGAYEAMADVDVVHDHTTLGPVWAAAAGVCTPVVVTVHNPFTDESRPLYSWLAGRVAVTAISHSHRDSAPEIPVAAVIHHGLDASRFPIGSGAGGFALFVGRITPEKGPVEAIRIARRAGIRLVMAAKARSDAERDYFERAVRPELDGGVDFLGEVGVAERNRLLGEARALVTSIRWREPFGLTMLEAMACGTPVVAFRNGAAPEIVTDGVTGFLCDDVEDAARALLRAGDLSRDACRAAVEGYFSAERMVTDYERLYERVLHPAAAAG